MINNFNPKAQRKPEIVVEPGATAKSEISDSLVTGNKANQQLFKVLVISYGMSRLVAELFELVSSACGHYHQFFVFNITQSNREASK